MRLIFLNVTNKPRKKSLQPKTKLISFLKKINPDEISKTFYIHII